MGFIVDNTGADGLAERAGHGGACCWTEDDARARNAALSDAIGIYRYRGLEQNLRRFGWRKARRVTLRQGALSRPWVGRGHGDLRLTRGGLEMRFETDVRVLDWMKLKEMVEARHP